MKKLIFLLTFLLLFLTFENSFAQTQTAEENENFSGIVQVATLNGYIPIINWPVEFTQDSNMYIVEFAVLSASSKNISSFPASRNGSIRVFSDGNTRVLELMVDFIPTCEDLLAKTLYQAGVEQIMLEGRMVSISDFAWEFKNLKQRNIKNNRTYISPK